MKKIHIFSTTAPQHRLLLLGLLLLVTAPLLQAQVVVGGDTPPAPSAALDLRGNNGGLLIPRMTTAERSAIASPAAGLLVYNTSLQCLEMNAGSSASPDWTCLSVAAAGVGAINCGAATPSNSLRVNMDAAGTSVTLPYTGGNGNYYKGQAVASTGVTGLTASLAGGYLASGSGNFSFAITGTPASTGIASFAITVGGQSCTLNLQVICGAFVASGQWKEFMCHNLGANPNVDPLTPNWELIGNYYQWGRNPSCFGRDGTDDANPCSSPVYGAAAPWGSTTANDNIGAITGWGTAAPNGAWTDGSKTASDPCPAGFRVPTASQLTALANATLNPRTLVGTWGNDNTAYDSGFRLGQSLFLPATGLRLGGDGTLVSRSGSGYYWSSTEDGSDARHLLLLSFSVFMNSTARTGGYSLRCVSIN